MGVQTNVSPGSGEPGMSIGARAASPARSLDRTTPDAAGRIAATFALPVGLVLLRRALISLVPALPLIPPYLYSFDTVNMALALKEFDPTRNQPQPPGYPFFVAEERLLHQVFRTPEITFFVLEILICGLAAGMM